MRHSRLKPWPADAVMIIAADAGYEDRNKMEGVYPATCRDCGARLVADTASVRRAEALPSRMGRPVKFFCISCYYHYDLHSITELHDDRWRADK